MSGSWLSSGTECRWEDEDCALLPVAVAEDAVEEEEEVSRCSGPVVKLGAEWIWDGIDDHPFPWLGRRCRMPSTSDVLAECALTASSLFGPTPRQGSA